MEDSGDNYVSHTPTLGCSYTPILVRSIEHSGSKFVERNSMKIAKVLGSVVSTQKEESLRGVKFLLVQYIDEDGNLLSDYEVAADRVGAGVEEWVLVTRGSAARQLEGRERTPLDATIVGIIDTISVSNRMVYSKRSQDT